VHPCSLSEELVLWWLGSVLSNFRYKPTTIDATCSAKLLITTQQSPICLVFSRILSSVVGGQQLF
jgi:hypothetical protein